MGISNWTHGRIMRSEQSGNLDGNQSNKIFEIQYNFGQDDDNSTSIVDGTGTPPSTSNLEQLTTGKPLVIKEYTFTVAGNDLMAMHQYYGDSDQIYEWNTSNESFHKGIKQWKLIPGSKVSTPQAWERDSLLAAGVGQIDTTSFKVNNQYAARTIHFDTDYIKRKGKKGYWKNGLRPIVLSKNKGHRFGFTVSNLSGNNDSWFYAIVEIKRWSIID